MQSGHFSRLFQENNTAKPVNGIAQQIIGYITTQRSNANVLVTHQLLDGPHPDALSNQPRSERSPARMR
jgi:hypothetical protein